MVVPEQQETTLPFNNNQGIGQSKIYIASEWLIFQKQLTVGKNKRKHNF